MAVLHAIVTGAAGFIGSHVVDRLLQNGIRVTGIDNLVLGKKSNLTKALGHPYFRLLEIDLTQYTASVAMLRKVASHEPVEIVWHLAANSDISVGVSNPRIDLNATFMTTFNILEIMRELNIRNIALASSSAVYGDHQRVLTEDTGPLFPISNYGAMKLASEASVSAAVESFLDQAWIFRFPNVVGARATHGVIHDFIRKLQANPEKLEILGDGTQRKEYLHVSELLDAMFFIIENGSERLNYFNIGANDSGATVTFIAETVIAAIAPGAQKHYTGGEKGWLGDVPRFNYSIKKLLRLGWCPRLTSEQAVIRAVQDLLAEQR
jgi:UDP-glucose 4-epimerase